MQHLHVRSTCALPSLHMLTNAHYKFEEHYFTLLLRSTGIGHFDLSEYVYITTGKYKYMTYTCTYHTCICHSCLINEPLVVTSNCYLFAYCFEICASCTLCLLKQLSWVLSGIACVPAAAIITLLVMSAPNVFVDKILNIHSQSALLWYITSNALAIFTNTLYFGFPVDISLIWEIKCQAESTLASFTWDGSLSTWYFMNCSSNSCFSSSERSWENLRIPTVGIWFHVFLLCPRFQHSQEPCPQTGMPGAHILTSLCIVPSYTAVELFQITQVSLFCK